MTEELLFTFKQNRQWFPVKLITYEHGGMDLVIQTGPKHEQALEDARALLLTRGLRVLETRSNVVGPSGAWYTVKEIL